MGSIHNLAIFQCSLFKNSGIAPFIDSLQLPVINSPVSPLNPPESSGYKFNLYFRTEIKDFAEIIVGKTFFILKDSGFTIASSVLEIEYVTQRQS